MTRGELQAGPMVQTILEWRKAISRFRPTARNYAHALQCCKPSYVEILRTDKSAGPQDDTLSFIADDKLFLTAIAHRPPDWSFGDREIGNDVQEHCDAFVEGCDGQALVVPVHAL